MTARGSEPVSEAPTVMPATSTAAGVVMGMIEVIVMAPETGIHVKLAC